MSENQLVNPSPEELATAIAAVDHRIQAAKDLLATLTSERASLLRETSVSCTSNFLYGAGCHATFRIRQLVFLQQHRYESPHGCSGGDTWHRTEGHFVCPACSHRNRLYDRPEVQALKDHFGSSRDEYPR